MPTDLFSEGRYIGRITKWGLGKAKTGTDFFFVTFDLVGRIDERDPDAPLLSVKPWERTMWLYITDKTIDGFIDDLKELGYTRGASFRYLDPNVEGAHNFEGKEIDVKCVHEEYEGDTKERWRLNYFRGGLNIEPMDSKDVRKLDALFGKKLKELESAAPSEPAPEPTPEPAAVGNGGAPPDDIPFTPSWF